MLAASLDQIIPELRDAVGPVILISGVGLLLLTMTNRLGRAIDRARLLKADPHRHAREQITILYRRAKLIRQSIILAATSALLAALLIIMIFIAAVLQWNCGVMVSVLFIACMLSLSVSLVAFIMDINLSLRALKLELEDSEESKGRDVT